MECRCEKKNCIRHGKCEECIMYHKTTRREPYCCRKEHKKHNIPVIISWVLMGLLVTGVIAFATTNRIIENRYKHIQEMTIRDVSITSLEDGNYHGKFIYGKNLYGVSVTIESGIIKNIGMDVETKDSNLKYVNKARSVIDDVIESQSLQVDCVSGATRSSKSILKAVENALSKTD